MKNIKCSISDHKCPEGLDTCCQFCSLNYSPCAGKCSGCWDEITTAVSDTAQVDYQV